MENPRFYGAPPYRTALIHGGPGALGELAPLARQLAPKLGVVEPLQTAPTLERQIEELRQLLADSGAAPCTLVGYSWGAWLSYLLAAHHPETVQKLIIVSSGPFAPEYIEEMQQNRLKRLGPVEGPEFCRLAEALNNPDTADKDQLLARLGELGAKAATVDPLPPSAEAGDYLEVRGTDFRQLMADANHLRGSGELVRLGTQIRCPVIAIHGDSDPHPAAGVRDPLKEVIADFRFITLDECGHTPWAERRAQEAFLQILVDELAEA